MELRGYTDGPSASACSLESTRQNLVCWYWRKSERGPQFRSWDDAHKASRTPSIDTGQNSGTVGKWPLLTWVSHPPSQATPKLPATLAVLGSAVRGVQLSSLRAMTVRQLQ